MFPADAHLRPGGHGFGPDHNATFAFSEGHKMDATSQGESIRELSVLRVRRGLW